MDEPEPEWHGPRVLSWIRGARRFRRQILATAALSIAGLGSCAATREREDLDALRLALVRSIEANGVQDSTTLSAMLSVPRHEFVPQRYRRLAYYDGPLPIGHDQTISQPFIVAFMTAALRPRPGLKVLEIGTGSGYQAAVLARTGAEVWTIEIIRELADQARARLQRMGCRNVHVRHGNGYLGWPEEAPFGAIILTAAPDSVPPVLIEQLAPGGRLVAPVGGERQLQQLVLIEKDSTGAVRRESLLPVRFVPMRNEVR